MPSRIAAAVVAVAGIAILLGWKLDIGFLKSGPSHWVTVKPNESLGLVLGGAALFWLEKSEEGGVARWFSGVSALGVALIGWLTLAEYFLQIDLRIDQALVTVSRVHGMIWPARMGMNAASALVLLGTAMLLSIRRRHAAAQLLVSMAMLIALQQLVIYTYGSETLYFGSKSIRMSLYSAATFVILCLGILLTHPSQGVMKPITGHAAGSMMAKRLLPTIILVPLAVGWLRSYGEAKHYFGPDSGTAIVAVVSIAILVLVVWFNALWLNKAEAERECAAEALRRSEERYRQIIETTHEGVWVIDSDGMTIFANRQMAEMLLSSLEEMQNRSIFDFVFEEEREARREHYRLFGDWKAGYQAEVRYRRQDDTPLWTLRTTNVMLDDQGRQIGTLCMLTDIGERRRTEEAIRALNVELEKRASALETVNNELEAFSYSVSHDLRSPLNAIDGYTRIVMEEYGAKFDKEGLRVLGTVRSETERMGKLIEDLLAFSRIGRQLINTTTVDMTALAKEVFEALLKQHQGTKPKFEIEPLPTAWGDMALLRQVFVNLLSNAIKFSSLREEPCIRVGSCTGADSVTYSIKDNGAGFDPRYADRLFGVFQRLHSQSEFKGTGVGLALVQRIVLRHRGSVWAESEVNQGATFFFSLPTEIKPS